MMISATTMMTTMRSAVSVCPLQSQAWNHSSNALICSMVSAPAAAQKAASQGMLSRIAELIRPTML
jgi:hypothetical protein